MNSKLREAAPAPSGATAVDLEIVATVLGEELR